jgi:hypothetical protein
MEVVPVTMPTEIRRRRTELVLRVQRADDSAAVFTEASRRLRRLVPFDAAVWLTTDPGTGLPTAPTLADTWSSRTSRSGARSCGAGSSWSPT